MSADGIKHLQPDGQGKESKVAAGYETEARRTAAGEVAIHALQVEYVVASDAEGLAQAAYVAASKRGLHEARERVALGDGAQWLWNQIAPVLRVPSCTEIVDFFHATQYLWQASDSVYGPGSAQAKAWAEEACHRLKHEGAPSRLMMVGAASVLQALQALPTPRTGPPEALQAASTYRQRQAARMDYPRYRRAVHYWPGRRARPADRCADQAASRRRSGSAESAVQRVVGARLNQPGMRWHPQRAEAVAAPTRPLVDGASARPFSALIGGPGTGLPAGQRSAALPPRGSPPVPDFPMNNRRTRPPATL
ncbi:MAG: hypothetical protein FJZ90_04620 [Chloroflexi bacterium]|nr:hypothetical protein [Chloroflexota bacterium]